MEELSLRRMGRESRCQSGVIQYQFSARQKSGNTSGVSWWRQDMGLHVRGGTTRHQALVLWTAYILIIVSRVDEGV